jgi:hypothetical protein
MIHLAVHRDNAQRRRDVAGLIRRGDELAAGIHAGLVLPQLSLVVAAARDLELVVLGVFAPRQRKPLLVELFECADVAAPLDGLRAQIQLRERTPAHCAKGVPVEADALFRRARVLRDEAPGRIQLAPRAIAVVEVVIARHAPHHRRAPDLGVVPFARFIARRLRLFDLIP